MELWTSVEERTPLLFTLRACFLLRGQRYSVVRVLASLRRRILEALLHCVDERPFLIIHRQVWETFDRLYKHVSCRMLSEQMKAYLIAYQAHSPF